MKLEQNDGIQRYEEDLNYEGKEYDVEIDASTGTFLEWIEEGAGQRNSTNTGSGTLFGRETNINFRYHDYGKGYRNQI